MKSQSYMTRAMQARDPRFATILGRLGYERSDMTASQPETTQEPQQPAPVVPKSTAKRKARSDKASS